MIVGTAGHIDHGKTTLTRALTGVDTDRLKEEKARGISIELGYAYAPLENGEILGVIDVPGHEKFIRTMAAGVTGIDAALLVIAADDGIMPQTLEHLAILRLLGVRRGAVALTKIDRVDASRVEQVERDIETLLAATDFADAPIFRTNASAAADAGVQALLRHLALMAAALPASDERRLFRLGVDRVFTLSGQGTIVTGTALAGSVRVGDVLQLAPGGQQARVRSIHAQNRSADSGRAGQRLALNLSGVSKEEIQRGSWVVAPALASCSERIDAELTLTPDCGQTLKPWSPLHVHLGAAHHTANVVMLDSDVLTPGQTGRVQLVLDAPVHAVPGDRFVIRNAQATATIGGGTVLDPFGPARKRRSATRLAWLQALSDFVASGDVASLLARSPLGLRMSALVRLSQMPADQITLPTDTIKVALQGGDHLLLAADEVQTLDARILDGLAEFHARAPDDAGPELWHLKRIVAPEMEDRLWSRLIETLIAAGQLKQRGRSLHLPGHSVELSEREQAQARPLLASLLDGAYDPPWVRDLSRDHGVQEAEVRRLLLKLSKTGEISQLVPDLFYHPKRLAELAALVASLPEVQASAFRDATGLGRKRAIQILEFFDRVGYTRRVGNIHLIRPNAAWSYSGE
ncbi:MULTISPECIES: selenocysteine-specific translation elongation factor [unclassified Duganella]|uniref:selenocysteine-specific translation elongation factor n=1 Tax=unclassified Duganella TaxID=2636909 RepID=UPI000E347554|nr:MULTISPECIES: selenocysteine-specific translation elongation factor [unclassified Duganella]RFP18424.1 selenocysteine-specific translation elongation factor [Duganella sp. BJB475]RFP35090.1 selenocysteine-specific translation elongation factor [Duganella sp. BJB476]